MKFWNFDIFFGKLCTKTTGNTFISYKKLFLVEIEPTRVKIFIIPCEKCQFLFFSESVEVSPKFHYGP